MPGHAWPPALRTGSLDAMPNFEIGDHPVYDGLELQWFDDVSHGTGMLALLTRRDSHVVDYYRQRGLRLDRADYQLGAGTGVWVETDFADAGLEDCDDGLHAAALFTDADGRRIEVRSTTGMGACAGAADFSSAGAPTIRLRLVSILGGTDVARGRKPTMVERWRERTLRRARRRDLGS